MALKNNLLLEEIIAKHLINSHIYGLYLADYFSPIRINILKISNKAQNESNMNQSLEFPPFTDRKHFGLILVLYCYYKIYAKILHCIKKNDSLL
jgi:hypothetical protein